MRSTMKLERHARKMLKLSMGTLLLAVIVAACGGSADETEFGSDPAAAPKVAAAVEAVATEAPTEVAEKPVAEEPAATVDPDGDLAGVAAAESLFVSRGCGACHQVSGIPTAVGTIGPELDGTASQPQIAETLDMSVDNMKAWLANPPGMKSGTAMPNLGLSADDVDLLAAWLMTLQ
ncbi:MAG TPA: c-type cytochrome [Chloroflexota bacterium]|nr:c-type cytochrome [Chloroflexota bacterium]